MYTLNTKAVDVINDPVLLQIDMTAYSLWGGSAGARMSAGLGSYGTASLAGTWKSQEEAKKKENSNPSA